MRPLLHVCAMLLALPQVLLCGLFLAIGHVTGGGTLGSLFARAIETMFVLFTWGGLLALVVFFVLLVAGFSARWRRYAAGIVALIVLASGVTLAVGIDIDPFLFLPGTVAFGTSLWLLLPEGRKPVTVLPGPKLG